MAWRFEIYETLGSTSDLCKSKAESGTKEKLAVQALVQTSGRGTHGRSWITADHNLAVSFLFFPKLIQNFLQAIPFIAAISLYESVIELLPSTEARDAFMLKWPNDLLLFERKVAGILIESGSTNFQSWVVVGIGANLKSAPVVEGRHLAALAELMTAPDPIIFAKQLGEKLDEWCLAWEHKGFEFIREAWLKRAHPIGRQLAVQSREIYITGTFAGLDKHGRLLLVSSDGKTIPVVTGDILLD